jgi:hypothetical protein
MLHGYGVRAPPSAGDPLFMLETSTQRTNEEHGAQTRSKTRGSDEVEGHRRGVRGTDKNFKGAESGVYRCGARRSSVTGGNRCAGMFAHRISVLTFAASTS